MPLIDASGIRFWHRTVPDIPFERRRSRRSQLRLYESVIALVLLRSPYTHFSLSLNFIPFRPPTSD